MIVNSSSKTLEYFSTCMLLLSTETIFMMSFTLKGNSEISCFSWSKLDLPENWNQFLKFLLDLCSFKNKFTVFKAF